MRSTLLVAVLVPAHVTTATIDAHLVAPMRYLIPSVIDSYRLGGVYTGAWDPGYSPRHDPANWRPCSTCGGSGRHDALPCPTCADAERAGRPAGTVVADADSWEAHSGDIVPLTAMLADDWRFPTGPALPDGRPRPAVPGAYADPRGTEWLGGGETGTLPRELRRCFETLLSGARAVGPHGEAFDADAWSVAVVAARRIAEEDAAVLPAVGSVVLITDPDFAEDDAGPGQLYVVSDDVHAPYYQLVRLGGYGPLVPGFALTEVDPARVILTPAPDGTPPYRHTLRLAHDAARHTDTASAASA
jgi:hypothetical protein